jgi:hypothetical protein
MIRLCPSFGHQRRRRHDHRRHQQKPQNFTPELHVFAQCYEPELLGVLKIP